MGFLFPINGLHRPTEQVGVGVLRQRLITDIFHVGVECLQLFELVGEEVFAKALHGWQGAHFLELVDVGFGFLDGLFLFGCGVLISEVVD